VLTLQATGVESLWDEIPAGGGQGAARGSGGAGPTALRPGAAFADRGAVGAAGGRGGTADGAGTAHDRDGDLRALNDRQASFRVGYGTLVREVSDSLHLRRFCRIGMTDGCRTSRRSAVVHEITRELISKARREKRFRPRAARIDSTVVEADVKYPTDAGLADGGVRALAREGRQLAVKVGEKRTAVRDRSRAIGRKLRALTRSIRRRSGIGEDRGAGTDRTNREAARADDPRGAQAG
jgi:hypothetical protein